MVGDDEEDGVEEVRLSRAIETSRCWHSGLRVEYPYILFIYLFFIDRYIYIYMYVYTHTFIYVYTYKYIYMYNIYPETQYSDTSRLGLGVRNPSYTTLETPPAVSHRTGLRAHNDIHPGVHVVIEADLGGETAFGL